MQLLSTLMKRASIETPPRGVLYDIARLGLRIRFRGDLPYLTRTQSRAQNTMLAPRHPHT